MVRQLTIGCKDMRRSGDAPDIQPEFFWPGCIDELAIFNHTLSVAEIRQLFEGRPAQSAEAVNRKRETP